MQYEIGYHFRIKEITKAEIRADSSVVSSTYMNIPAVVEGIFRNNGNITYWVKSQDVGELLVSGEYIYNQSK